MHFTVKGKVHVFPGINGWHYVDVPQRYTKELRQKRLAWGMYPIQVTLGNTTWQTKLMIKKGDAFFVALRANIRKKESIKKGDTVTLTVTVL